MIFDFKNSKSFLTKLGYFKTGRFEGAAVLLQKAFAEEFGLQDHFITLNCRHHEHELYLSKSFCKLFPTAGARTPFLDRFQVRFDSLDKQRIEPYNGDKISEGERCELLKFIDEQLVINHSREEYKQLLEAAKLFLIRIESPKLVKPSRYTHSRWMKPLIQSIYVYIFRNQFEPRDYPIAKIERLCVFGVKYYLKPWFHCPIARFAPVNDLNLFKSFLGMDDSEIKRVCLETFKLHDTYLSEELAALSFFDERLETETLRSMVRNLSRAPQKLTLSSDTRIEDLINCNTLKFFQKAHLHHDFIDLDPIDWPQSEVFNVALSVIRSLHVVNDTTERTISLCKNYSNILTKDNDNLSNIIHTIESDISSRRKPTKESYQTPL